MQLWNTMLALFLDFLACRTITHARNSEFRPQRSRLPTSESHYFSEGRRAADEDESGQVALEHLNLLHHDLIFGGEMVPTAK